MADLFNGQHGQICNVREQIKADDYQRAVDEDARQILFRILHFSTNEADVCPTIINPQYRDQGQAEARKGKTSSRDRRSKMAARSRETDRKREGDEQNQRTRFRERGDVLNERAPSDADVIECGSQNDRRRRDVVNVAAVRKNSRVVTEYAQQVFRKSRGDGAECCRANDDELGPAKEKCRQTSPGFANENVDPTGSRERSCNFSQREGTTENKETAGKPDREQREWARKFVGNARRRAKDSRADRRADEYCDSAPQPETARQRRSAYEGRVSPGARRGILRANGFSHSHTLVQSSSGRE